MTDRMSDRSADAKPTRRSADRSLFFVGTLFADGGLYFVLVGPSLMLAPSKTQRGPN